MWSWVLANTQITEGSIAATIFSAVSGTAGKCLPDGTKFEGPAGLQRVLLRRPDAFVSTLTDKLLTYSLGRLTEYHDEPAVRRIVNDSAGSDYKFSAVILGIVRSTPFQMRKTK